eukprot:m.59360 g.59360  ORF g.59360 m.59360 type:complete len:222 (-) comp7884_c0_seq2:1646-2311(-)
MLCLCKTCLSLPHRPCFVTLLYAGSGSRSPLPCTAHHIPIQCTYNESMAASNAVAVPWHDKWAMKFPTPTEPCPTPPGLLPRVSERTSSSQSGVDDTIVAKIAWNLVVAQGQSLPMNLFMMWMSGSHVNLWSIMMTSYMCWGPIGSLMNMSQRFQQKVGHIETDLDFTVQKVAYVAINLLSLFMAAYKLSSLGLLPTTDSDWLEFMEQGEPAEFSSGGFVV